MEEKWLRRSGTVWLRLMTRKDTDDIVRWRNQDFVRERFLYRKPFTVQGHLHWIRTQVETGHVVQMMICLPKVATPVGSVYFRDIDRENRKAEYGIFIGERTALGKGLGTETARLALDYAFHELGLHRVMLRVLSDNVRARRSYARAGFVEEAHLHDDVFLDGAFRDVILMAAIHPGERRAEPDKYRQEPAECRQEPGERRAEPAERRAEPDKCKEKPAERRAEPDKYGQEPDEGKVEPDERREESDWRSVESEEP